ADLQSVPEDLLAEVGDVLADQVQGLGRASQTPGFLGAKLVAEIMNVADEADTIRDLMFTFEDLLRLDDRGMQVLLKDVARDELMLALKTASPAMRDKVLRNLSQRAGEILQEDMSTMGPVRLKEVERAQAGIVAAARRLDAEQKITLGARGDDVVA